MPTNRQPKLKTVYICSECGYESPRWNGRCAACGQYDTLNEEVIESVKPAAIPTAHRAIRAETLQSIGVLPETRTSTGIAELDRVLNGGFVEGSLTLVGGEPGIGKSTLLLQLCKHIGGSGKKILYVSGEESVKQIKMRADRLGVTSDNLYLLAETGIAAVEQAVAALAPVLLIIDSIQTMMMDALQSAPGSVTQVRECTAAILRLSKGSGVTAVIVGHVTKEGAIAGPRVLEHMVDAVLYFEGERRASYRLIRAVKNRFGATDEIGVFEMRENGLAGIENPSEYLLSGRPVNAPGSCVTCSMEGTRPILAEVQALAAYTTFGTPRRVAAGLDFNRGVMLIAVLEKRAGMQFGQYDVYFNLAGGMRILEPAVDAAVVAACASSYRNKPVDPFTAVFGEIGLAGELRAVSFAERRVAEAAKLGFRQCVIPQTNLKNIKKPPDMTVYGAAHILELLELLFP